MIHLPGTPLPILRTRRVPPLIFNPELTTFTPSMAKRAGSVFAGAPIVQGAWDGTGTPDVLTFSRGSQIVGNWYDRFDPYQGGGFVNFLPEQSSGAQANLAYIWYISAAYNLAYDYANGRYSLTIGTQTMTYAQAVVAGTVEYLAWGFDCANDLDGTNYAFISRNDTQGYGITTQPTVSAPGATPAIGSNGATLPSNALIEGLVFTRVVPWTGSYGTDLGQGDLVAIHAAGADIAETIGSWDTGLSVPTDASVGALVTGEGESWSHPHGDNLIPGNSGIGGWMSDGTYGTDGWSDEGTPSAVAALAAAESIFAGWGYKTTSDAADEGLYQDVTVTAGDDFVIRVIANSDGTSVPRAILYDQDNTAEIGHLDGDEETELVTNVEFTTDTASWTPVNVTNARVDSSADPGTDSTTAGASDKWALKSTTNVRLPRSYQTIAVVAGATYEVSCLAYAPSANTTVNAAAILIDGNTFEVTAEDSWQRIEGTFIASSNSIVLNLSCRNGDDATVGDIAYFDDVSLRRISTREHPDVLIFTGEAPAGCTTLRVKLTNTAASGVTYWHQVELYTDLWDDPSFEAGTAVTDVGTPTTSAQDAGQARTGTNSWKVVADAADEGIKRAITTTSGEFYQARAWVYADTAGTVDMEGPTAQTGSAARATTTTNDAWEMLTFVFRATAASTDLQFTSNAAQTFYVDDVAVMAVDAVSLTATPASEANSAESGGIRVVGRSTLTQPTLTYLRANEGRILWKMRPRHAPADILKFAEGAAVWLFRSNTVGGYWLGAAWTAANTITMYLTDAGGALTDTWDCTGEWSADDVLLAEYAYRGPNADLRVDGAIVATITGAGGFGANILTTMYWGTSHQGKLQADAVFLGL